VSELRGEAGHGNLGPRDAHDAGLLVGQRRRLLDGAAQDAMRAGHRHAGVERGAHHRVVRLCVDHCLHPGGMSVGLRGGYEPRADADAVRTGRERGGHAARRRYATRRDHRHRDGFEDRVQQR
jgi:hypothetical protein